jgi:predicted acyltransferase
MALFPVPNYGAGVLTKVGNFSAFIDRLIIPAAHLYKPDGFNSLGDPEGVFSTIPASVNILFGYFTGNWLKKQKTSSETSIDLVMMGLSCLIIGGVWDFWFPISKKLWTSPYVIFTTGWALIALAMCYELVDVRQIRKWFKPMEIMGLNAIFAFVGSVVMIKLLVKIKLGSGSDALSIYGWINRQVFTPLFGSIDAGLIIGILMIILWWLICNLMYQKKLFLKI